MDDVDLEAALTEAHAPVDEPATSADELDEDDEAVCLLSSLSSLHAGAWVVLHSLVRKPELNGRVCVLIGQNDGDADRWDCHMLLEGRAIAVKPDNLSVVAPCTWKSAGEWRREEMERTEAVVRGVRAGLPQERLLLEEVLAHDLRCACSRPLRGANAGCARARRSP